MIPFVVIISELVENLRYVFLFPRNCHRQLCFPNVKDTSLRHVRKIHKVYHLSTSWMSLGHSIHDNNRDDHFILLLHRGRNSVPPGFYSIIVSFCWDFWSSSCEEWKIQLIHTWVYVKGDQVLIYLSVNEISSLLFVHPMYKFFRR